jgi:hypothetical protein
MAISCVCYLIIGIIGENFSGSNRIPNDFPSFSLDFTDEVIYGFEIVVGEFEFKAIDHVKEQSISNAKPSTQFLSGVMCGRLTGHRSRNGSYGRGVVYGAAMFGIITAKVFGK